MDAARPRALQSPGDGEAPGPADDVPASGSDPVGAYVTEPRPGAAEPASDQLRRHPHSQEGAAADGSGR